jgi:hypothetical protein
LVPRKTGFSFVIASLIGGVKKTADLPQVTLTKFMTLKPNNSDTSTQSGSELTTLDTSNH